LLRCFFPLGGNRLRSLERYRKAASTQESSLPEAGSEERSIF
jgi:hypothetical protein